MTRLSNSARLCVPALVFVLAAIPAAGQSGGAAGAALSAQGITIVHPDAIPFVMGPPEHFTGSVKMETLAEPRDPGRPRVLNITFAPGAYTAWHSHPLGQLLVVTAGTGYIQQADGPVREIHAGDVIWTPPGVKHWHGAGPNGAMTHISIYDEPKGQVTKWLEPVTAAEYGAATSR